MKGLLHIAGCIIGMLGINGNSLAQSSQAPFPNLSPATTDSAATYLKKTKPVRHYQFYAGSQAAAHSYMVASNNYPVQRIGIYPLYMFVGYHPRYNLAVQIGFLQNDPPARSESTSGFDFMGRPFTSSDYENEYNAAIPVSVRYCFTGPHRLYLEALLGVTTEFNRYRRNYVNLVDGQINDEERVSVRATNTYLAGGLAIGYRASSRINIMIETTALRNLTNRPGSRWDPAKEITPAIGAGLRYNFDLGQKKA